jgi:hypothetical protein
MPHHLISTFIRYFYRSALFACFHIDICTLLPVGHFTLDFYVSPVQVSIHVKSIVRV